MTTTSFRQRPQGTPAWPHLPLPHRVRIGGWAGYVGLLTLLFVQPLGRLVGLASQDSLHSHIPLVPLIAGYLLYVQRQAPAVPYRTSLGGTVMLAGVGCRGAHRMRSHGAGA